MGYVVKKANGKKRPFKLQFETSNHSTGKRVKKSPSIPFEEWGTHGFRPTMTIEEARTRAHQLNADSEEKRHSLRKVAIGERIEKENRDLALSISDERDFIAWCEDEHRIEFKGENKLESHWQCAKRVIAKLGLKPADYYPRRRKIYRWFEDEKLSLDYLKKVLRFVNLYGDFIAHTYSTYFKAVPYPKGQDRQDIANAYRKSGKPSKEARPLTHELLTASEPEWKPEQYRWLYLSLWLGLRPEEVDNLKNPDLHKWEKDSEGTLVLIVYQTKLERTVEEKNRWKRIPLIYPEQAIIPDLMKLDLERPLVKTMRRIFKGKSYGTYSGRKGFEALLVDRGQSFQYVSAMLGHQKTDITYQKYMDRTKARYDKPKKAA